MKRKSIIIGGIVVGILLCLFLYWFYFSDPDAVLTKEKAAEGIGQTFPDVEVDAIQDVIMVDRKHAFVPFVSKRNEYSMSFWVWENHAWKADSLHSNGEPYLWKVKNDPAAHYIVWNIHPDDQVADMRLYFIRERGYNISDEEERYAPRVQLEKRVDLRERLYGASAFSDEWLAVMEEMEAVELKRDSVFDDFLSGQETMYIGWSSYDSAGKQMFPEQFMNNSEYVNGNERIEFIRFLQEEREIEE